MPNGVNIKQFYKKSNKFSKKIIGDPCLLSVGSITHRKGQINLINSLPLIIEYYPQVHYHCIGLPIEERKILKIAKQLDVEKYLTLHGFIPNNILYEIYNQADIFIMLSQSKTTSDVEGFGIAILEAKLSGVPAIGTENTGIEDAIVHNKTGKLVNPYLAEEILHAMDQILSNKDKLSKNAVKWAHKHNWNNISTKYLELIENA